MANTNAVYLNIQDINKTVFCGTANSLALEAYRLVGRTTVDVLTNKTLTDSSNVIAATALQDGAGGSVAITGTTAAGRALEATSATTAAWTHPIGTGNVVSTTATTANAIVRWTGDALHPHHNVLNSECIISATNTLTAPHGVDLDINPPGVQPVGTNVLWYDDTDPINALKLEARPISAQDAVTTRAIYVSKYGNDAGKGSQVDPLLTITAAITLLGANPTPTASYIIHIGAGTYTEVLAPPSWCALVGDGAVTIVGDMTVEASNLAEASSRFWIRNINITGNLTINLANAGAWPAAIAVIDINDCAISAILAYTGHIAGDILNLNNVSALTMNLNAISSLNIHGCLASGVVTVTDSAAYAMAVECDDLRAATINISRVTASVGSLLLRNNVASDPITGFNIDGGAAGPALVIETNLDGASRITTLAGTPAPVVTLLSEAEFLSYSPTTSTHWATAPTTTLEALDALAAGTRITNAVANYTAFATGGRASATALAAPVCIVNVCATAGDSVGLPAYVRGREVVVLNNGAATCNVFTLTATADHFENTDATMAYPLLPQARVRFIGGVAANTWQVQSLTRAPIRQTSAPAPFEQIGSVTTTTAAIDVQCATINGVVYAFVLGGGATGPLKAYNCSDPRNPYQVGSLALAHQPTCMAIYQASGAVGTIFVGEADMYVQAIDVSNPGAMAQFTGGIIRQVADAGIIMAIAVRPDGTHIYTASTAHGLGIIDVTSVNPMVVTYTLEITSAAGLAYITTDRVVVSYPVLGQVHVWNVNAPAAPIDIVAGLVALVGCGSVQNPVGTTTVVAVTGGQTLRVITFAPDALTLAGTITTASTGWVSPYRNVSAGIGNQIYVTSGTAGHVGIIEEYSLTSTAVPQQINTIASYPSITGGGVYYGGSATGVSYGYYYVLDATNFLLRIITPNLGWQTQYHTHVHALDSANLLTAQNFATGAGAVITQFDDTATLVANSATRGVTQAAVKGYIDDVTAPAAVLFTADATTFAAPATTLMAISKRNGLVTLNFPAIGATSTNLLGATPIAFGATRVTDGYRPAYDISEYVNTITTGAVSRTAFITITTAGVVTISTADGLPWPNAGPDTLAVPAIAISYLTTS